MSRAMKFERTKLSGSPIREVAFRCDGGTEGGRPRAIRADDVEPRREDKVPPVRRPVDQHAHLEAEPVLVRPVRVHDPDRVIWPDVSAGAAVWSRPVGAVVSGRGEGDLPS